MRRRDSAASGGAHLAANVFGVVGRVVEQRLRDELDRDGFAARALSRRAHHRELAVPQLRAQLVTLREAGCKAQADGRVRRSSRSLGSGGGGLRVLLGVCARVWRGVHVAQRRAEAHGEARSSLGRGSLVCQLSAS